MSEHLKSIEIYGVAVNNIGVSAFESVEMLHRRSSLDKVFDELNHEEQLKLLSNNVQLIQNTKKMSEHIAEVYDFSLSEERRNHPAINS
ncbi:hypothetical protein [Paenibacillus sp. FSL H8-0283]|uniref:hypothetical protein n=1 Tax=Paenibacillus sp. FSL H8-0283 TaxID=2921383 RepID=UPI003247552B